LTIGFVTMLAAACLRGSLPRDSGAVIDQFLAAAVAGDSLTIRQLTIGEDPASKVAAMRQREPALLSAVSSERRLQSSVVKGDSVYVAYRFQLGGQSEILTLGLVRRGDSWVIYNVGIPSR
jgi:hypothetical protein